MDASPGVLSVEIISDFLTSTDATERTPPERAAA